MGYQKFTDVFIYFWESCMLDEGSATKLQPRLHSFHFFEASGKCWSVDCELAGLSRPSERSGCGSRIALGSLESCVSSLTV